MRVQNTGSYKQSSKLSRVTFFKLLTFLLCVTPLLAGGICAYELPSQAVLGYENNEDACRDGEDNDGDRRIDCEDPDCMLADATCGGIEPLIPFYEEESNYLTCTDGIDNDNDGTWDCGERTCQAILELCCIGEFTNKDCSDGIDNDGNNFTDCEDFGCSGLFTTVCDDVVTLSASETGQDCYDGIDNDGNGFGDCRDFSCADECIGVPSENSEDACSNGVDDDRNTYVDCDDRNCENTDYCRARSETTLEKCSDGVDNDENGYTDCGDFSCSRSLEPEIIQHCAATNEGNTLESCTDGIDNDGNGYVDCADNSCAISARDIEGRSWSAGKLACSELAHGQGYREACSDGIDNDGNGFTDCEDAHCIFAPVDTGCALTDGVCGATRNDTFTY